MPIPLINCALTGGRGGCEGGGGRAFVLQQNNHQKQFINTHTY